MRRRRIACRTSSRRFKKNLYKLSIWAQIDVEGAEVTSTLHAVEDDLDDVNALLAKLEEKGSADRLKEAIQRYSRGVEQALILINRSPRIGATATRGMERVYLEADEAAGALATSAKDLVEQRVEATQESWQRLMIKFLLMIAAVALLVPALALGSDRIIAKPTEGLASVVDQFRQGKLDIQVPWTIRKDEIGLVARAMESFRENRTRPTSTALFSGLGVDKLRPYSRL